MTHSCNNYSSIETRAVPPKYERSLSCLKEMRRGTSRMVIQLPRRVQVVDIEWLSWSFDTEYEFVSDECFWCREKENGSMGSCFGGPV